MVPAPPPIAAPMSAPFLPPKIAPTPAPAAVVPPITIALFFQSRRGSALATVRVAARSRYTTRSGAGAGTVSYTAGTGRTWLTGYAAAGRAVVYAGAGAG